MKSLIMVTLIQVKIIGVEPADANAMALSLHHGERVMLDQVGGFADGVAVKEVGEETFRICQELVDGVVLVSRDAICASIKVSVYKVQFAYCFYCLSIFVAVLYVVSMLSGTLYCSSTACVNLFLFRSRLALGNVVLECKCILLCERTFLDPII